MNSLSGKWVIPEDVELNGTPVKYVEYMRVGGMHHITLCLEIGNVGRGVRRTVKGYVYSDHLGFVVPEIGMFLCWVGDTRPSLSEHPIVGILKEKVDEYLRT